MFGDLKNVVSLLTSIFKFSVRSSDKLKKKCEKYFVFI
jgi:hypothetical protein